MDMHTGEAINDVGPLTRLLIKLVGGDEDTLRQCPPRDHSNLRACAWLMLATWLYQTGIFALIGHRLFAAGGQIRAELILVAMFLGTYVILIDCYIMRCGWYSAGITELKRGGIDISGGISARLKAGLFVGIRIFVLSIGNAELSAVFLSLFIFGSDIDMRIHNKDAQLNANLIQSATARVDADTERAAAAVKAHTVIVDSLSAQLTAIRQQEIDPAANDPRIQQAQQEVSQLVARKDKAEEDVRTAEAFASNELLGIRGTAGNSGQAGRGVRYKAAMEQVTNARARAQGVAKDLNAARARLDNLRQQIPPPTDAGKQRSNERLGSFEKALDAENDKLTRLKEELGSLTTDREKAIRKAVANAPDHVEVNGGLIAQISVLDHLAQESKKITLVIVLIGVVSFGFELAAVLAKVTSYVPMSYTALLARDTFVAVVKIADDMTAELDAMEARRNKGPDILPPDNPRDDQQATASAVDPSGTPQPPKRKRGRPRKHPLPTVVTGANGREGLGVQAGQPEPA
jgi:hypothetical protein